MTTPHCLQANATALKKRLSNLDLSETPAIIWKIALQALLQNEPERYFQIWFSSDLEGGGGGGGEWRRSEHAHASYPGLFFSPARVQPLYGGGKERRVQELN